MAKPAWSLAWGPTPVPPDFESGHSLYQLCCKQPFVRSRKHTRVSRARKSVLGLQFS